MTDINNNWPARLKNQTEMMHAKTMMPKLDPNEAGRNAKRSGGPKNVEKFRNVSLVCMDKNASKDVFAQALKYIKNNYNNLTVHERIALAATDPNLSTAERFNQDLQEAAHVKSVAQLKIVLSALRDDRTSKESFAKAMTSIRMASSKLPPEEREEALRLMMNITKPYLSDADKSVKEARGDLSSDAFQHDF